MAEKRAQRHAGSVCAVFVFLLVWGFYIPSPQAECRISVDGVVQGSPTLETSRTIQAAQEAFPLVPGYPSTPGVIGAECVWYYRDSYGEHIDKSVCINGSWHFVYYCTTSPMCADSRVNTSGTWDVVCDECEQQSDCPVGKECSGGQCIDIACTEHRQCPTGFGCADDVCVAEAPPVITDGPFLAAGSWPVLPTSASNNFVLDQNYSVLWTFEDDYATCEGLCTHRAKYRRLDGTQWFELQAEADETGRWYAMVELPVNNMRDGTYVFQIEVVDCFGQIKSSKYRYFKVAHPQ